MKETLTVLEVAYNTLAYLSIGIESFFLVLDVHNTLMRVIKRTGLYTGIGRAI